MNPKRCILAPKKSSVTQAGWTEGLTEKGKMNEIRNDYRGPTNWYVITGGPSSGKTTTVNILNSRGYRTTIEHARHYLDSQRAVGKTVEEVLEHQAEFQLGILNMQLEQERTLSPADVVFLDRAIPDALAYYRFLKLPPDARLLKALASISYRKVLSSTAFHWCMTTPGWKMKPHKKRFIHYVRKFTNRFRFRLFTFLFLRLKNEWSSFCIISSPKRPSQISRILVIVGIVSAL